MPKTKAKGEMVLISVHFPRQMLQQLDELVSKGVFPSRSEAVRYGVMMLLSLFSNGSSASSILRELKIAKEKYYNLLHLVEENLDVKRFKSLVLNNARSVYVVYCPRCGIVVKYFVSFPSPNCNTNVKCPICNGDTNTEILVIPRLTHALTRRAVDLLDDVMNLLARLRAYYECIPDDLYNELIRLYDEISRFRNDVIGWIRG